MKKLLGTLVCALLLSVQLTSAQQAEEEGGYILKVGDKAADFSVELLNGKSVHMADLNGNVVLLTFWATWCPPCMQEMHSLPAALQAYNEKNFVWLPISRGEKKNVVAQKMDNLKKEGIVYMPGLDPDKTIWGKYATIYIPKTFLIDKKGIIRFVETGYSDEKLKSLLAKIDELLK